MRVQTRQRGKGGCRGKSGGRCCQGGGVGSRRHHSWVRGRPWQARLALADACEQVWLLLLLLLLVLLELLLKLKLLLLLLLLSESWQVDVDSETVDCLCVLHQLPGRVVASSAGRAEEVAGFWKKRKKPHQNFAHSLKSLSYEQNNWLHL